MRRLTTSGAQREPLVVFVYASVTEGAPSGKTKPANSQLILSLDFRMGIPSPEKSPGIHMTREVMSWVLSCRQDGRARGLAGRVEVVSPVNLGHRGVVNELDISMNLVLSRRRFSKERGARSDLRVVLG